jgi:hypothetical protein
MLHRCGDLRAGGLGRNEERLALAGALGGEDRVAAHEEALAAKLWPRDLREIALIEQPQLEIAGVDERAGSRACPRAARRAVEDPFADPARIRPHSTRCLTQPAAPAAICSGWGGGMCQTAS